MTYETSDEKLPFSQVTDEISHENILFSQITSEISQQENLHFFLKSLMRYYIDMNLHIDSSYP